MFTSPEYATENQYFITTHSAALLDGAEASIYHVTHDGQASSLKVAATNNDRHDICRNLGYRASDILQSNCVVWVEGPTDRIYLKYWISQTDPGLAEGLHYSIMFYGGRLLSHLSAEDSEVEDFISLRKLNRNMIVLMDSDIKAKGGRVNETKNRVCRELAANHGIAWVTDGREVENYVPRSVLEPAILATNMKAASVPATNRYQSATRYLDAKGKIKNIVDKVRLARKVVELRPGLETLDLEDRIMEIVSYIREVNK